MPTVAEAFNLNQSQAQLDFVNVDLDTDLRLFVDPLGLSQRADRWSIDAHRTLVTFFQEIIDRIRAQEPDRAQELLYHLSEPNETHLGFSRGRSQGAGIGGGQAHQIFSRLAQSTAVQTGFITSLQDCELMIPNISHDKVSDLTTNIIRRHLVDYTATQCALHGIPTGPRALPPMFDPQTMSWQSEYVVVPSYNFQPLLLVPKAIIRRSPVYDSKNYYNNFVIEYLRAEALSANSSLVRALKNGKRVVYAKDVKEAYPFSKEFLYTFSRDHPEVLEDFRRTMKKTEQVDRESDVDNSAMDSAIADALAQTLRATEIGSAHASTYHSLMVGIVEFLFYPHLAFPVKEREIHEGRKRIDIVVQNCARADIFFELHAVRHVPAAFVPIECKNYNSDVANQELDQLAGRMSTNNGMFGFLCCRHFDDRGRFVARCRDTFADRQQLIVPLDDDTILAMLDAISRGARKEVLERVRNLISEVCL